MRKKEWREKKKDDEEKSVRKSKNGVLSERPHFLVWHGICFAVSKLGEANNE